MTSPSKRSFRPAVPARLFAAPTECPGRRLERVSDGLCVAALAVARNGDAVAAGHGACVIIRWWRRWSTSTGPWKRCLGVPCDSATLCSSSFWSLATLATVQQQECLKSHKRARVHVRENTLHRVGRPAFLVPPLADPRDVSFPGAPGQVAGGVGGIALGDEVRVFPCYESSAAAAGMRARHFALPGCSVAG